MRLRMRLTLLSSFFFSFGVGLGQGVEIVEACTTSVQANAWTNTGTGTAAWIEDPFLPNSVDSWSDVKLNSDKERQRCGYPRLIYELVAEPFEDPCTASSYATAFSIYESVVRLGGDPQSTSDFNILGDISYDAVSLGFDQKHCPCEGSGDLQTTVEMYVTISIFKSDSEVFVEEIDDSVSWSYARNSNCFPMPIGSAELKHLTMNFIAPQIECDEFYTISNPNAGKVVLSVLFFFEVNNGGDWVNGIQTGLAAKAPEHDPWLRMTTMTN